MTKEELKNKCKERAKIFQQAMESCKSSNPIDCIEWFADRIAELEKENAELKKINSETLTQLNLDNGELIIENEKLRKENAGLKAGRPQWHKITDWKDNSQFPNDEIKNYLVRLYQDHYVICEVDITEGYRQFYLTDNLDDIDPQEVIAWCEIPTFDKE